MKEGAGQVLDEFTDNEIILEEARKEAMLSNVRNKLYLDSMEGREAFGR